MKPRVVTKESQPPLGEKAYGVGFKLRLRQGEHGCGGTVGKGHRVGGTQAGIQTV